MIRASRIKLTRAEGRPHECVAVTIEPGHVASLGNLSQGDVFYAADQILSHWAATAPDSGGYDKCDFEVEYEDGETYEGRYDLVREDTGRFDKLGEHIRRFQKFCAGLYRPDHLSEDQYAAALKRQGGPSEAAKRFLVEYQIGVAPVTFGAVGPVSQEYKQARGAVPVPEGGLSAEEAIRRGRGAEE